MPGLLSEKVYAYFTISGASTTFILDDAVRGVLDGATYTLSGDVAVDVSSGMRSVRIDRGRERAIDDIMVGVATVEANNYDRTWDPLYASGPYIGNIRPGKRVTITTNGFNRFDGLIDDLNYTYPIDGDSIVEFDVADALGTLGSGEFDEWTATPGDTPGFRLGAICNRPEIAFPATRYFDDGTSTTTLQGDVVSWGSNALNYAQLVAKCDLGQLFASKDGVLTYYSRSRVVTGIGAPVFSSDLTTDPGSIVYSAVALDYGTELLYNRVSVDAQGFTKQTVTDATSFSTFQKYWSLSLSSLPLADATQAYALASYILNLYSQPVTRISSITVDLHALESTDQSKVLALDIGSVVRVKYTPNRTGTAVDQFALVEGISDLIGAGGTFHSVTLKLSKLTAGYNTALNFILDDPVLGVLDTDLVAF